MKRTVTEEILFPLEADGQFMEVALGPPPIWEGDTMDNNDNSSVEKKKVYANTREDLLQRSLSNSENMDKAILSLSSAFLGVSLGLIKNIVDISTSIHSVLLVSSWWLFAGAIILTLISFLMSQRAIKRQLVLAERYYLQDDNSALFGTNPFALATEYLNVGSAFVFILAVIASIVFISLNLGV